uniref:Peptidoglycan recognition protein family domain-containing protein n=1 Tax=Callorhinchus milii TaxID=7868 RepID=A0A4W3GBV1_CALMI
WWQGSHTKGQNAKGYGVAFIGNYTAALPDDTAIQLVRDTWTRCAVAAGNLVSDYAIHGHRQHRNVLCPGERLFLEIKTWEPWIEAAKSLLLFSFDGSILRSNRLTTGCLRTPG